MKLFFPEEMPELIADEVRRLWSWRVKKKLMQSVRGSYDRVSNANAGRPLHWVESVHGWCVSPGLDRSVAYLVLAETT
jgi:hypothetical protein